MVRKKRTKIELLKASEHLFYEYWMFTSLAKGMASGIFNEGVINNAILESFTIHVRVLLGFLFAEKPREDDVIAEDYISDGKWEKVKAEKSEGLKYIHSRVGKEVAHLTYERLEINTEGKLWNFVEIANQVNSIFNIFLSLVPKEFLGNSWQKNIEKNASLSSSYYFYENWIAEGHKVRIHSGSCPYCRFGAGVHNTDNEEHGRWLGPYTNYKDAYFAAIATGGKVSQCKHCATGQ